MNTPYDYNVKKCKLTNWMTLLTLVELDVAMIPTSLDASSVEKFANHEVFG